MKKLVQLLLVAILGLSLIACGDQKENDVSGDYASPENLIANESYFEWSSEDNTHIVGYTKEGLKQTALAIPERCTLVTGLEKNETVKYIAFQNAGTAIASGAFKGCAALEKVDLPGNLTEIKNSVFGDCVNLKEITLPASLKKIGSGAFANCTSLEVVSFGEANEVIKSIEQNAFMHCESLKEITIPDSVVKIGDSAFKECSSLSVVNFGRRVKTIGNGAFTKCNSLKDVNLPKGITTIKADAFAHCDSLEAIYLPASLKQIQPTSIVQSHMIKVYVVKGSYMDSHLAELNGLENYDKQYQ